MQVIEEKVDRLEFLVAQTQLMIQGLTVELRREMKDFKTQTQSSIESLSKEIKDFKTYTQLSFERMNKKWEEAVKKFGTIVEDMVIPNIEFITEKHFNLKNGRIYTRTKVYNPEDNSSQREFDVIALYPNKIVLVEAKSNPKPEEAKEFIEFIKSGEFFEYFPEYKGKELIPIFASFHIPDNVLKKLSKNKIYAMGIKEDTMDILNPKL